MIFYNTFFYFIKRAYFNEICPLNWVICEDFLTGLRGYQVYRNIWKPYVGQNISFRQERDNKYDRFAGCGLVKIPGKIELTIVGHIPREISRYVWYAMEEGANIGGMEEGANIAGKVVNGRYKPSPLLQGGLEIPIKVFVQWYNINGIKILQEKVERVGYPADEENYTDDSKEILKSL